MRIVITGAAGAVGAVLTDRLGRDHEVIPLAHRDLDITNSQAVARVIAAAKPAVLINCATVGVDESERDRGLAAAVNSEAVAFLARAAQLQGSEFLQFSTNYVFGKRDRRTPYTTKDDPEPVNVYGVTKLTGECAALMHCDRSYVVRTSWVFGAARETFLTSVVPRLRAGERVRAINDIHASTTWVHDLAERVATLVGSRRYGVHHIANAGVCTYEQFAREAARIARLDAALIDSIGARDAKLGAPRPRYTPLACDPPLRPWQDALAAYIREVAG